MATRSTKTSRSTKRKSSTKKPTAVLNAAEPTVVEVTQPMVKPPELRKRELVDLIIARTERKQRDVKPVVEETLRVMGEMLAEGRELNLLPFGKLKIKRSENKSQGQIVTGKIRLAQPETKEPTEALAEPNE